ncbi:MAG: GumC family protein [Acidobacteriota bacterium]
MALSPVTPRDRLQRLVDLGKKTLRYWWLIAVFAVVGGALSLVFALTRARNYQSYAVLFYQERIQSSLLSNREEQVQRNIGDRYRELLLARGQLEQIIADPKLNAYPDIKDPELAIDKLRTAIRFESRGANAFRINYTDVDPDRAKAVTEKLTKLLQDKDEALRNEQAQATVNFATTQKEEAGAELRKREQGLAEFLAKHPEFAQDPNQQGEGASIRAIRNQKAQPTGNPRLYALERQRQRIEARLDAPPDAPPVRIPAPPSPEKIAADAAVAEAQRELSSAKRDLEDAMSKYTDRHPAVIKAQERVASAQQRLRTAEAAVPPDIETPIAPATPADRTKLQKELSQLESQISDLQKAQGKGSAVPAVDATTNWVVQLETQHADLRRAVNEQRERVESLADSVFRAQMDANQKSAETGGQLSVVDPAFKPGKPTGPGKTIFLLAGVVLFLALGGGLAIGMAVLDDRVYRRADVDQLGIAVLAVIPRAKKPSKRAIMKEGT